jgi:MoaA/NifB/PqqE/SkfB family radical SAM enzyme
MWVGKIKEESKMVNSKERISCEKIFHSIHKAELEKFLKGDYVNIKPINAEFHPTMACNWDCYFCNTKNVFGQDCLRKEADEIMQTSDDVKWIADELAGAGILSINISGGGEPLMNKFTPDFILYLKERDIQVGLVTNGYGIEEKVAESLLNGCTWIRFSVNAIDDTTFDAVNGTKNGFTEMMSSMETMLEVKKRIGSPTVMGMNYMITKENYQKAGEFADLNKKMGFDFVGYKVPLPGFDQPGPETSIVDSAEKQINDALKRLKDDKFDVFPFHIERFKLCDRYHDVEYDGCPMAYFFIVIRHNGDIVPCTHIDFRKEGLEIHNLRDIKLKDALRSEQHLNMLSKLGKNFKCLRSSS